MPEPARGATIFMVPVTRNYTLHPTYDQDLSRHLSKEFKYCCHRDAPVVTPVRFSVFEYLERYPIYFDVRRFSWMPLDGNELQVLGCFGERGYTAVAGSAKAGIIGAFAVMLDLVVLERRRTCRFYAIEKKWNSNASWPVCWHGCATRRMVVAINRALSTLWGGRGLMDSVHGTIMSIERLIEISRCACVRIFC